MARRALTDPDEGASETWALDAPIAQERWRCSAVLDDDGNAVYEPHAGLESLDDECAGVVEEIAALTSSDPCADCPLAQTRSENNPWVHSVTRAYRDNENGALALRYPNPPAVLMDALDLLRNAVDARNTYDAENRPKPQAAPVALKKEDDDE